MTKGRKIGGWVITALLTALYLFSAAMKFTGGEDVITGFEKYGLADMRFVIGAGEVASALLYLIPLTASLGVLLLSAYMGGAICTHMSNDEPYVFPSIILILVWAGYYLRYPEMFISFTKGRGATADAGE